MFRFGTGHFNCTCNFRYCQYSSMPFPVVVSVGGAVFCAVIFSDSESTNEVFRSQCLWPHFSNKTVDGDNPPWIVLKELPTGSTDSEISGFALKHHYLLGHPLVYVSLLCCVYTLPPTGCSVLPLLFSFLFFLLPLLPLCFLSYHFHLFYCP